MGVVVQKYGGSSVADIEKIGRVADRVVAAKREGHDLVVVVSAMGKATDELLALAKRVAEAAPAKSDAPRRELDMLVSTGERVTMSLLSIAIAGRGMEAISFTGSQSGIITSDRHFDARIVEVRPHRIEEALAQGKIVIVAGYQGMSVNREITTLGRGGSDTTAVALAAALNAERCEIYSDVDGVYSADPRAVPDPAHLPEMDLALMQEMAEAGAKVLNAQAVEWARKANISIVARKTADVHNAETKARETVAKTGGDARVRAVVGLDRVVLVRAAANAFAAFTEVCGRENVPLMDVAHAADVGQAVIPLLNLPDWEGCKAKILKSADVSMTTDVSVVSVVGDGLTTNGDALRRGGSVMAGANIAIHAMFATALRVAWVVPTTRATEAQQLLHAAFVTGSASR